MKKLPRAAQAKVDSFLANQARPLERHLYLYQFRGGALADVLAELARLQNSDGGFGHGLEPDLRLPASSVIATSIAFQRFRQLGLPANLPMVRDACRYLSDHYDAPTRNWPIIPPTVDEAPHAPWWTYGGDLSRSLSNPRAELVGYLYDYPVHFSADMCQQATASVLDYVLAQEDKLEMHDLMCFVRLVETPALPEAIKQPLFDKLKRIAQQVVRRDPAQWAVYGLQPLGIVSGPQSPFAALFQSELEAILDFMIDQLDVAGFWKPNWSWAGQWPAAWAEAESDWRAVLTLANLHALRAFGWLE